MRVTTRNDAAQGWWQRLAIGLPLLVGAFAVAVRAVGVGAAIVAASVGPLLFFGLVGTWNRRHRQRRDLARPAGVLVDAAATVDGAVGRFSATTEALTWEPKSGKEGAVDIPLRCVDEVEVAPIRGPFISAARLVIRTTGHPDREIVVTYPAGDLARRLEMLAQR